MNMRRRSALPSFELREISHLGLALSRYLPDDQKIQNKTISGKTTLVTTLSGGGDKSPSISPVRVTGFQAYFERHQRAAKGTGRKTRVLHLTSRSRCALGLGGGGPLENGLATHHTYGVPILSGSSLRGLAASFAARHYAGWQRDQASSAHAALFGRKPNSEGQTKDSGNAGLVSFLDALPLPTKWTLHLEVMTVHHQHYYGGQAVPPADWDSPVPIPFLSVTGTFELILSVNAQVDDADEALDAVTELLTRALDEEGIGAKTSSGFGRFSVTAVGQAAQHAGQAPNSRQPAPANLPDWLQRELRVKWTRRDLMNSTGKPQQAAKRVVNEAREGGLDTMQVQAAAQAVLTLFTGLHERPEREFSWWHDVQQLSRSTS